MLFTSCKTREFNSVPTEIFAGEPQVEFAFNSANSRIYLVSNEPAYLKIQCHAVSVYSKHIAEVNRQSVQLASCDIKDLAPEVRVQLEAPSYGYNKDDWNKKLQGSKWISEITNILPKEIWQRARQGKLYNSICYNAALVESGMLRLSDYTMFQPPVEYFLSHHTVHVDRNKSPWQLSLQRFNSQQPLIRKQLSWEISNNEIQKMKTIIKRDIENNFSPGSVLCVDGGLLWSANRLLDAFDTMLRRDPSVKTQIDRTGSDETKARTGGHCLAFITPDLITESNSDSPHNLVSWDLAYNFYANFASRFPEGIVSFSYFQTDTNAIQKWSQVLENGANQHLSSLLSILRQFTNFYETIEVRSIQLTGNSSIKLFSKSLPPNLPEVVELRKYVADVMLPALKKDPFVEFIERRDKSQSLFGRESDYVFEYWSTVVENLEGFLN